MPNTWQLWIDTGGTFTDCIAISPDGRFSRIKVLSSSCLRGRMLQKTAPGVFEFKTNWDVREAIFQGYDFKIINNPSLNSRIWKMDFDTNLLILEKDIPLIKSADFEITTNEEAPVLAARLATLTRLHAPFPPIQMRLGTTKGTNALLEGKGARVAFLITKGFGDLPEIGNQQRPDLFQLDIPEPNLLYQKVIEVEERLNARGEVIQPLTQEEINRIEEKLKIGGFTVVAVTLLHAYKNPVHEKLLENALKKAGIPFLSRSSMLSPTIKILPRAQTTLVDAYLAPIMQTYLANVCTGQDDLQLKVMTSAGGLANAGLFHPKDSLLSGPAGGVVGAAAVAEQLGFAKVLTLDMGGTSTDTARYDGRYDYRYETRVGDFQMTSPSLSIETVAAGGGSICHFDGFKLCVGPESAGAMPGPACYGAGGPLTITDVNLLLGKLEPSEFGIPIDKEKSNKALKDLQKQIREKTSHHYKKEELLTGFEQIANEKMAEAIRRISVIQGFDPTEYALLVFGGAGGLHGCKIAELLDISTLILPCDGGLLSAYGIGHAQLESFVERQVLKPLSQIQDNWESLLDELKEEAFRKLEKEGVDRRNIILKNILAYLRFAGQESTVEIPWNVNTQLATDFEIKYRKLFGHWPLNKAIELESLKVIAATKRRTDESPDSAFSSKQKPEKAATLVKKQGDSIPVYRWSELEPGQRFAGPAIVLGKHATAFLEKGWEGQVRNNLNLVARLNNAAGKPERPQKEAIELELFTNRFKAIALEMGAQLQRTAFSVNVKERLDFSCAILDANAELLVNAPHIPVHLGSLGICARLILKDFKVEKGDVIITNHPKYGGSHLPDITLLSGAFLNNDQLIGYVINRAHHAEIGGKRPGSMPPDAVNLAEEGVVIPPTYLVKSDVAQWRLIENLLTQGPYPSRALNENLADINAALAALRTGEEALKKLVASYGLKTVHFYMSKLKETAKLALKEALAPFHHQTFQATEFLDDGHRINVSIDLKAGKSGFKKQVGRFMLTSSMSPSFSGMVFLHNNLKK